jgi:hypothetical protein
VQFELAADEGGTLVTLSQSDLPSLAEVLADTAGARGALATFWSLAIANLADYLAGRELTPKCDFTSNELRACVVIDAAPDAVFDSMTQPEQFCRWFGANVDIEPYVDARCSPVKSEGYRRCRDTRPPSSRQYLETHSTRNYLIAFSRGFPGKCRSRAVESNSDPRSLPSGDDQ